MQYYMLHFQSSCQHLFFEPLQLPDSFLEANPAFLHVRAHRNISSFVSAMTSLVDATLASLKAAGARGVFTILRESQVHLTEWHAQLDLDDVSIDDDFQEKNNVAVFSRKLNVSSSSS